MPQLVKTPTEIKASGNKEKLIKEFIGNVNTQTPSVSIARMESPEGWEEPGQTPEFTEYTVVLSGTLRVDTKSGFLDVAAGQAVIVREGEWVKYSSPYKGGAGYIAVCLPAFSPELVNRDE